MPRSSSDFDAGHVFGVEKCIEIVEVAAKNMRGKTGDIGLADEAVADALRFYLELAQRKMETIRTGEEPCSGNRVVGSSPTVSANTESRAHEHRRIRWGLAWLDSLGC